MKGDKSGFSKISVRHVKGYVLSKSEDGDKEIILPEYAYSAISRSHTKRYHNCLYLLAGLNPCSRNLMDYMTEQMDEDNVVSTNEHFRHKFMEFIKNTTKGAVEYRDGSVKKAISSLCEKGLVRQMGRGYVKVNPEYFWKNNDENRLRSVMIELEFKSGANTRLKVLREKLGIKDEGVLKEPDAEYIANKTLNK